MLTIPRSLALQFRAVLRRCARSRGWRGPCPFVLVRAGPDGVALQARLDGVALRYYQPGSHPPEEIALPADVLARFDGRDDKPVALTQVAFGKGRAHWAEGGVPQAIDFETVAPESLPAFPDLPGKFSQLPPAFLAALGEAVQTAARDEARFAVSRILLRGKTGEVVATDGRQLLVQGGIPLPWEEDVLVPALPVFASRDLPSEGPVAVGRTETHVAVAARPR